VGRPQPQRRGPTLARGPAPGRAVQLDPIRPKLILPGIKRLKLTCHLLLSTSAFEINLRRYTLAQLGLERFFVLEGGGSGGGVQVDGIEEMLAGSMGGLPFEAGAYTRSILSST